MTKVVIISGGSDGLGKEMAKTLSVKNKVVILSPNKDKLEQTAKEIGCEYEVCNVADYGSVSNAVKNILKKHNRIDCLINNAGLWIEGELDDNEPKRIKKVVEVNTLGVIYLTKAVIPQMKKQSNGLIININSQGGIYGKSERGVYTATKWAITGLSKCLQPELAKYGIAVTGVYPGKMKTKIFEKIGIHKDMTDGLDPKNVARTIEFLLTFDNTVVFPEVGIKNIKN